MHPFLKWPGSKRALLPELHARMPRRYGRYFEPFLGSGALYFSLQPKRAYLSDLDCDLMATYRCIRDHPTAVARHLQATRNSHAFFTRWRNIDRTAHYVAWPPTKRAARIIYLNKASFHGLMRKNGAGQFNNSFGHYKTYRLPTQEELCDYSAHLKKCDLQSHCYTRLLQKIRRRDFIYLDPPYDGSPITYGSGKFSLPMQLSLLGFCRLLNDAGVYFMLSNADTKRIKTLFSEFNIEALKVSYAFNAKKSRQTKELLIRNYD